jgi:hypothetical protein
LSISSFSRGSDARNQFRLAPPGRFSKESFVSARRLGKAQAGLREEHLFSVFRLLSSVSDIVKRKHIWSKGLRRWFQGRSCKAAFPTQTQVD